MPHITLAERPRQVFEQRAAEQTTPARPRHRLPRRPHFHAPRLHPRRDRPRLQWKLRERGERVRSVDRDGGRMHLQSVRDVLPRGHGDGESLRRERRGQPEQRLKLARHPLEPRHFVRGPPAHRPVGGAEPDPVKRVAAHKRPPRAIRRADKRPPVQQRELHLQVAPHARAHDELHVDQRQLRHRVQPPGPQLAPHDSAIRCRRKKTAPRARRGATRSSAPPAPDTTASNN